MAVTYTARAGSLSVRFGSASAKTFAAAGGPGDNGQRQTDAREPRPGYSACCAPLLSPCGMGAASAAGISRLRRLRRGGTNHSMELSVANVGVEDCAGAGHGEYGRTQAGGVYPADGARVCGG